MQILVLGAGAIGTLYAARLARAHDVLLVTRRPEQADAIRTSGVRVTGLDRISTQVAATSRVTTIWPRALVILTTKVYDSVDAITPLVSLLRSDTIVLCVQNGLGGERFVREAIGGRCAVLRAITNFGAIFAGPGEISLQAHGDTIVEDGPSSAALAAMFTECDLAGRVSPDIRYDVWKKLIVNCVINPLTAITGMEVGWIADPRLNRIKQRIVDECLAVAKQEGVSLDIDFVAMLNEVYGPSRNLSSMHQDIASGRRTEIDYMNGAVVELGHRHGVPCPANAGLVALVSALETSASSIPAPSAGIRP